MVIIFSKNPTKHVVISNDSLAKTFKHHAQSAHNFRSPLHSTEALGTLTVALSVLEALPHSS